MFLLLVNLYEFGQFLRILLWISLPMVVVAMLVTTWLHYRRKHKTQDEMTLSMEGLDLSAEPEILIAAMSRMSVARKAEAEPGSGSGLALEPAVAAESGSAMTGESGSAVAGEPESAIAEDTKDKMYRGILWMKEKYEQYRDLADERIGQLKEQLAKVEKKYQDLLAAQPAAELAGQPTSELTAQLAAQTTVQPQAPENIPLQQQLEEKDRHLEEKDRQIEELQSQLKIQGLKTEELVAKLQHSSQLLLNISLELYTSTLLDKSTLPPQPQA